MSDAWLTPADLALHQALGITPEILARAQVHRVSDRDARDLLSMNGRPGDMSGVVYPYLHPVTQAPGTHRIRRDRPEIEAGKPVRKYMQAFGDRSHLYFPPECAAALDDATVQVIAVEAEKSVLAIMSAAERRHRDVLPIGLGGCWGFRGRTGKTTDANGARVDELGPLPDLDLIVWTGRPVAIAFDSNAATNARVQLARKVFARELASRGAHVSLVDVPADDGVNGPDDFIGRVGAEAFFALIDQAVPYVAPGRDRLTDAGAAERFARLLGHQVRYDHRRQRWLMWQGHRWLPDADAEIMRVSLAFARTWLRETLDMEDADQREKAVKFVMRLERKDGVASMLSFARALKPIAAAGDQWDRDPWLLGVPNGVVDLRTGTLRPGRPSDALTMGTTVPFHPGATCPRWEQFVGELFADDSELVEFVQRAIGYSLTGITTEQVLFLLYGTGANGKGTLTNTLARVLGDYGWNMPFATVEMRDRAAIPNDLAALVGRRFVIASETNDGTRLNESRVKALTGCDPMTARFLHGEFFTFEPVSKFWLSVNHKPVVRDDSHGFWRRLRLIPFTQQFPVNTTLVDELCSEATGILAWGVRGCLAWQHDGLAPPLVVTEATVEYERDSDLLADFLHEACEIQPGAVVTAAELNEHYRQWADGRGLRERDRISPTMLGRKMAERFAKGRTAAGHVIYTGFARRSLTATSPDDAWVR